MAFPKHIFITSLAMTIVIFLAGLMLGWYLDSSRTSSILTDIQSNELDTESYLVEQAFWDSFGGEDCAFSDLRLSSISLQLSDLGQYLSSYQKKNIFQESEFQYLARRYFILEIKGYVLYNELKTKCDVQNDVILYFYGPDDPESEKQGFVLDKLVQQSNHSIDIFSINKDFAGDQAIETLKIYYNITTTPTIIVNGNEKREGYVGYDEVKELLDETSS